MFEVYQRNKICHSTSRKYLVNGAIYKSKQEYNYSIKLKSNAIKAANVFEPLPNFSTSFGMAHVDKSSNTANVRSLFYNTTVQPEVRSEFIIREKKKYVLQATKRKLQFKYNLDWK